MATLKSEVYNKKGNKVGYVALKKEFFDIKASPDLLHRIVRYYSLLERKNTAKTKDRSEKRGGGKKPWRQKGTGRARHGSRRSPIWIGGGVTFGPSGEKKYEIRLNKKERKKALFFVLSRKLKDGEIIFLEKIEIKNPKTKEIADILNSLSKIKKDIKKKKTIFILESNQNKFSRLTSNIKNILTIPSDSLNPYFLLKGKYLIIEKDALENIQKGEISKKADNNKKKKEENKKRKVSQKKKLNK
ncbi:MAG: 50S ribosomal protein L4 [Candidatus Pacebacteria bacterium]|nr:50S ribosomal protein L4 [Candidatus Paceibacterota bacterium]